MAKRRTMSDIIAGYIKWFLQNTDLHQDQIAAQVDQNQGRVSEIKSGQKYGHVPPVRPPWFPA